MQELKFKSYAPGQQSHNQVHCAGGATHEGWWKHLNKNFFLIATENTHRFNAEGMKQNSVLRYTILPIQQAVDCYHERQMAELQHKADAQTAKNQMKKLGVDFVPTNE